MGRAGLVMIALLATSMAVADTVYLKTGVKLEGSIRRVGNGWEIRQADGQVVHVAEDQVKSLELGGSKVDDADEQRSRLDALRKSVEQQSDLSVIIKRYEMLVSQLGDSPVARDAKEDLANWRNRQKTGEVKVAGKWLTTEELQALDEKSSSLVEEAKADLKAGRNSKAASLVDKILAADPENPGALYLKGLILVNQNQVGQARKLFEQVATLVPDHGPSLTNAAVLEWRQKAYSQAYANYDRAMQAMPLTPRIHDNVAEALNDVPKEARNAAATKRLAKRFADAEPDLQKEMAKTDRYRWGSTWVDKAQLEELKAQEAAIQKQLSELAARFTETENAIQRLDASIEANNRSMSSMENNRSAVDANGNAYTRPYPDVYYETQRDNERKLAEKQQAVAQLELYRKQASDLRGQVAVPPYSGTQKLFDEEAAPTASRGSKKATPTTAPSGNVS